MLADARSTRLCLARKIKGQGYDVRSDGLGIGVMVAAECEAAVVVAHRSHAWTIGAITALRSSEMICASIVVLEVGGVADVRQALGAGAVDCLIGSVGEVTLRESLAAAIACTQRWRQRLQSTETQPATITQFEAATHAIVDHPRATVFEPARGDSEERIEVIVRRIGDESQLTPREHEVLYWLIQGHRYDDIATMLGVAPRTAKFHASNLLRKLELDSRHDLPRLLAREA